MATPIGIGSRELAREILVVDVNRMGATAHVQPWGELDLATAGKLRAALDGIATPQRLVLDMRGLSFIDSTGLHLLAELQERAVRERFELELIAPLPPADSSIRVCGLDGRLPFVEAPVADELAA